MSRSARRSPFVVLIALLGLFAHTVQAADPQPVAAPPASVPANVVVLQDVSPSATLGGAAAARSAFGGISLSSLGGVLVVLGTIAAAAGSSNNNNSTAGTTGTGGT